MSRAEAIDGREKFGDPYTLVNFYNDLWGRKENAVDEVLKNGRPKPPDKREPLLKDSFHA